MLMVRLKAVIDRGGEMITASFITAQVVVFAQEPKESSPTADR